MKLLYKCQLLLGMYLILLTGIHAQTNQWTWVNGNKAADQSSNYGTKGVPSTTNYPGTRAGSICVTDKKGNAWIFGGFGTDSSGNAGLLNDLWKWDGTNWTWLSGSKLINQIGNYGTQGIAGGTNTPGARQNGCGFIGKDGNFWLFGGNVMGKFGYPSNLNDLWKWDGVYWTFIKGGTNDTSGLKNYLANYGAKGVASATNNPPGRSAETSWTDKNGNFWFFGGAGFDSTSGTSSYNNDMWKWDGTNWTWMRGSAGMYGAFTVNGNGIAANPLSTPGGRSFATGWTDKNGVLWLFGGTGIDMISSTSAELNELWKWDSTYWEFVKGDYAAKQPGKYGTKGVASPGNIPSSRTGSVSWTDSSGNGWVFGGNGNLNDLWKWDGSNWTWVNGMDSLSNNSGGNYTAKGIASPNAIPAARNNAMAWTDKNGKGMLFGGFGAQPDSYSLQYHNDLWSWDGKNWTWLNGIDTCGVNVSGFNGSLGIAASANIPESRSNGISWMDKNGNFWLYGGEMHVAPYDFYSDVWKWDGSNWTWINGNKSRNQFPNYGIKGVAASTNQPGARAGSAGWTDTNGNLWLFGGKRSTSGNASPSQNQFQINNDFWKWDGTNWTFIKGNSSLTGSYGKKGITDTSNHPPSRLNAVTWSDKNNNLFMFGGWASINSPLPGGGSYTVNTLNDLWKWDGNSWTWIKGSNLTNQTGIYAASIGIADSANTPGSRYGSTFWKDSNDNLWLFGGKNTAAGLMNDLWKWDGTNWIWMNAGAASAVYGTKGVPASINVPGIRYGATGWVDRSGNVWLLGGFGKDASGSFGYLNDLWVFNGNKWAWMGGSTIVNQPGINGNKGVAAAQNIPAARFRPFVWNDNLGNFWLFGGTGNPSTTLGGDTEFGPANSFNDLWKLNYSTVTALPSVLPTAAPQTDILLLNNPTTLDQISILTDRYYQRLHWQLLDETGRILQEGECKALLKGARQNLPIHHINSGIYFVKLLEDDKKLQIKTLIKQ